MNLRPLLFARFENGLIPVIESNTHPFPSLSWLSKRIAERVRPLFYQKPQICCKALHLQFHPPT